MMTGQITILETAVLLSFILLIAAMVLTFYRLIKGPTLPDRVVALDLFVNLTIGMIFTIVIYTNKTVFLDAAVFIALIAFLATTAISRFLRRRIYDK